MNKDGIKNHRSTIHSLDDKLNTLSEDAQRIQSKFDRDIIEFKSNLQFIKVLAKVKNSKKK